MSEGRGAPGWPPSGVVEGHMDLVSGWMVGDADVASGADDR
ncbi:MAG: hypothetical protein ACYCU7_01735 [Acidimicrobiales bacterium]